MELSSKSDILDTRFLLRLAAVIHNISYNGSIKDLERKGLDYSVPGALERKLVLYQDVERVVRVGQQERILTGQ